MYAARSRNLTRLDGLRGARARGGPVRTGLIAAQAALTLVLLDGTATFHRSFEAARRVDVGYVWENLLTVELGGWNEPPIIEGRVDALEARVRSLARRAGRGAGDQRAAEDGLGAGRSCARRASTGFPA